MLGTRVSLVGYPRYRCPTVVTPERGLVEAMIRLACITLWGTWKAFAILMSSKSKSTIEFGFGDETDLLSKDACWPGAIVWSACIPQSNISKPSSNVQDAALVRGRLMV